jgi:hypothetical protein
VKRLVVGGVSAWFLLLATASAEVKIDVGHNDGDHATAEFKFKEVPSPVKGNAASTAKITIVDGERDPNGGEVGVLHDGKLPSDQDEPASNFFFNAGTDGGWILIDLGKNISVKQVNTYSWHTDTRAPQVYSLYAADGAATGFNAKPTRAVDPVKVGWKLVAKVDTRPKAGEPGGQYGVSISDTKGALGKYRYLLIAASRTEDSDDYGNTFFSEINVIDADAAATAPAAPADKTGGKTGEKTPAATPPARLISESPKSAKYQITIEYTEAPELKEWVEKTLQPTVDKWYPKVIEALPSSNYTAPDRVSIVITSKYRGVAATMGTRVMCNPDWFKQNLSGEAPGAVVHELVHVVQKYGGVRGASANPGWLVEGLADYIRWFKYEPKPTGTRPRSPDKANYTDSYRTTAGFLNFVVEKHDKDLVVKLNAAMRQGKYSADLWKQYTGKTVDELWKEYVASLR